VYVLPALEERIITAMPAGKRQVENCVIHVEVSVIRVKNRVSQVEDSR